MGYLSCEFQSKEFMVKRAYWRLNAEVCLKELKLPWSPTKATAKWKDSLLLIHALSWRLYLSAFTFSPSQHGVVCCNMAVSLNSIVVSFSEAKGGCEFLSAIFPHIPCLLKLTSPDGSPVYMQAQLLSILFTYFSAQLPWDMSYGMVVIANSRLHYGFELMQCRIAWVFSPMILQVDLQFATLANDLIIGPGHISFDLTFACTSYAWVKEPHHGSSADQPSDMFLAEVTATVHIITYQFLLLVKTYGFGVRLARGRAKILGGMIVSVQVHYSNEYSIPDSTFLKNMTECCTIDPISWLFCSTLPGNWFQFCLTAFLGHNSESSQWTVAWFVRFGQSAHPIGMNHLLTNRCKLHNLLLLPWDPTVCAITLGDMQDISLFAQRIDKEGRALSKRTIVHTLHLSLPWDSGGLAWFGLRASRIYGGRNVSKLGLVGLPTVTQPIPMPQETTNTRGDNHRKVGLDGTAASAEALA